MTNDHVEIFSIGTELVSGLILDTNAHWLADAISIVGGEVRRIVALPDDRGVIVAELEAAVRRRPRIVITSGGLGPTGDDLTVECVAAVAGCGVDTPRAVLESFAERRGTTLAEESSPSRLKMGSIPATAALHLNPVGWAPCFSIGVADSTIWSLPGPPREMEVCFATHIRPAAGRLFAGRTARTRVLIDAFESEAAPLMQRVMRAFPTAYLKAYIGLALDDGLPVDIVVRSDDGVDPAALLRQARDLFGELAAEVGKTVAQADDVRAQHE